MSKIKQQQYQELLGKDQLNMERDEGKVFLHFRESGPTRSCIHTSVGHRDNRTNPSVKMFYSG